jgi:hypothetical protein
MKFTDSNATPTVPASGDLHLIPKGASGLYLQYPNGNLRNLDSVGTGGSVDSGNFAKLNGNNAFTGRNSFSDLATFVDSIYLAPGSITTTNTFIQVQDGKNNTNARHLFVIGSLATGTGDRNGGNIYIRGGDNINNGTEGNIILAHDGTTQIGRVNIGRSTQPAGLLDVGTGGEFSVGFTGAVTAYSLDLTSGQLALADGGTNANITATNGGIVWSNATQMQVTAAGSSGQILRSGGAATPAWSTATYPATAGTDNYFLRSDGTNFVSEAVTNDIVKGGSWVSVTAVDSFVIFEARENYTLTELRCRRVGGTTGVVNVTRTRSGSQVDLYSANFTTTTKTVNAAFEAFGGGSLQNTSIQAGDIIRIALRSVTGTITELYVQLTMTESL